MRHGLVGQISPRTRHARRVGGLIVSLSLVAAAGVAAVVGMSSAATPLPKNLAVNPGLESSLSGWAATTSATKLDRVALGFQSKWAGRMQSTTTSALINQVAFSGIVKRTTTGSVFALGIWVRLYPQQSVTFQAREVLGASVVSSSKSVRAVKAGWHFIPLPYAAKRTGSRLDVTLTVSRPTPTTPVLFDGLYAGQVRGAAVSTSVPTIASATTTTPSGPTTTALATTSSSATTAWGRGLAWYQANTGVPAGTALTSSGSLTVTKAGTVIDGLNVNGGITVAASNVTIRNSRVTGTIQMNSGSMLVDHVEIDLSGLAVDSVPQQHGIFYFNGNAVVQFSKIHGMEQGIAWGGTGTFQDNYIYGIRTNTGHSEAILSNGGTSTTLIARNWLDSSGTGAISGPLCMYGDFGQITNVTVDGNLMTGVGYNYFGSVAGKAYPLPSNVTVTNNTFLPPFTWGSPVYPSSLDAQSTSKWSNNRLTTGAAVPAP